MCFNEDCGPHCQLPSPDSRQDGEWCSSNYYSLRRHRGRSSLLDARSRSCYHVPSDMPAITHSVSTNEKQAVIITPECQLDSSPLLVSSLPQLLSGSTFADSDAGYYGSVGLYEGSCDHLGNDYGRRYSAELTDDMEVFADETAQIPRDSLVIMPCSESQNADGLKPLETSSEEQLDIAASINMTVESEPTSHGRAVPLNEQQHVVAATGLSEISPKMCQNINSAEMAVPDQPVTAEAVGLAEIASKYTTVQMLLEMNQHRAGLGSAEDVLDDHSSTVPQSLDHRALASLATDYSVINECLQLGRVVSKHSASDVDGQNASDVSSPDEFNELTLAKDLSINLAFDDQVPKEPSLDVNSADKLGEFVSHDSSSSALRAPIAQTQPSHLYMVDEVPLYFPVYKSLRDFETGLFHIYPRNTAKINDTATEWLATSEPEQQRYIKDSGKDQSDIVSVCYATNTAQYINTRSELPVTHYSSLAMLSDVECGKLLASNIHAGRTADVHSTGLPLIVGETLSDGELRRVSEAETVDYNGENRESFDNHLGLADSQTVGFTLVESKKHKRQRKRLSSEDTVTHHILSNSSTSVSESYWAEVQKDDANAEQLYAAEPSRWLESEEKKSAECIACYVTEENPVQNFSEEVEPRDNENAAIAKTYPTEVDVNSSSEFSSFPPKDLGMESIADVKGVSSEEVVMDVVPEHMTHISDPIDGRLFPTIPLTIVTPDRPENAVEQETVAEAVHHLEYHYHSGDAVQMDTLAVDDLDDEDSGGIRCPASTPVEFEIGEKVDGLACLTMDNLASLIAKSKSVAVELEAEEAADVTEVTLIKQSVASETFASVSNETIRVERLTTVAPRSVVRVAVEQSSESTDVGNSLEPAVIPGGVVQVESKPDETIESTYEAATKHDPVLMAGNIETDTVNIGMVNHKEVCEKVDSVNLWKISETADVEKKLFGTETGNLAHMSYGEVRAEKVVAYYTSLTALRDVENGIVHNRLKARKFLQEWSAKNVDDIVAYIVGSEAKKQRRRHKRIKRASESELSEVRATERGSEMMTTFPIFHKELVMHRKQHKRVKRASESEVSRVKATGRDSEIPVPMLRAESEENILRIDEQPDKLDSVESDTEDQTIGEPEDSSEGESFTVVESRKHRRQRQRQDAEEMWANYLDDEDATEETEVELFADNLRGSVSDDREAVLESVADSLDSVRVVDGALETIPDESVIEMQVQPAKLACDGQLEMVRDGLEVVSTYTTEAAELLHDEKLDSVANNADLDIWAEICEPVAESMLLQQSEVDTDTEANTQNGYVPVKDAENVQVTTLEHTLSVSDGHVTTGLHSRLYADVARGKYEQGGAEYGQEITAFNDGESAVGMNVIDAPVEAIETSLTELPTESVEDHWTKLTTETESDVLPAQFGDKLNSLNSGPKTTAVADVRETVDKYVEDGKAQAVSDSTAAPSVCDETWPVAETLESIDRPTGHSLELPITERVVELSSTEQQHLETMSTVEESVLPVDLKYDVELSAADRDVPMPSVESSPLLSPCGLLDAGSLVEPSAARPDVESQLSDVGVWEASGEYSHPLPDEANLKSSTSHFRTEVPIEPAEELPALEIQSTEYDLLKADVLTSAEAVAETIMRMADTESTEEQVLAVTGTDDVASFVYEAVSEDEQHVAQLFSEGARAVQVRCDSAAAAISTETTEEVDKLKSDDSEVEVTKITAGSHCEEGQKDSALASVESFVAEILPYYHAALAVLRDVERGTLQPPCDPSSYAVGRKVDKMSSRVTKSSDTSDFTTSANDDTGLSAVASVEKPQESEKLLARKEGSVSATIFTNASQSYKSSVPMSLGVSKQSDESDQQCGLQRDYTVDSHKDKYLLDHNYADVVTLQNYYQSLKLLHSVETGNLPLCAVQLAASNVISGAPDVSSAKQFKEQTAETFTQKAADPVCKSSSPICDVLKDVLPDDASVMCSEHQQPSPVGSELTFSDVLPTEAVTPTELLLTEDDADSFARVEEVLQEHSSITTGSDNVVSNTQSSDLFSSQRACEQPIETAANKTEAEADARVSHHYGSSVQDERNGRDDSCVGNDSMIVGDLQCPVTECNVPEVTVSTDIIEQLAGNICDRDLLLQQQHVDATQITTEPCAGQSERPLSDKDVISIPTVLELSEEKTKKKKKSRKKKPKSPKDDLSPVEFSPGCSGLPSVDQNNASSENISEACFPTDVVEAVRVDDVSAVTTGLISSQAGDSVVTSGTRKDRRRRKKAKQLVSNNMAVDEETAVGESEQNIRDGVDAEDHICDGNAAFIVTETVMQQDEAEPCKEAAAVADSCLKTESLQSVLPPLNKSYLETAKLPSLSTDNISGGLGTLNASDLMSGMSHTDLSALPSTEEENVGEIPIELGTQNLDIGGTDSTADDGTFTLTTKKPAKRKNRRKRKTKTSSLPTSDASIQENEVGTCDNNVLVDTAMGNHEQLDSSVVAETDEIMTESLEEDTRITEQPLDILSVEDSKQMSEPLSFHLVPPLSQPAGKKKKNGKTKAGVAALPCTAVDEKSNFVTDSSTEAKDDLSAKYEIIDESSVPNITSELATAHPVAGELDKTEASLSVSRGEERKTVKETQLEIDSNGEASSGEEQQAFQPTELAEEDITTFMTSSTKRKKKSKRSRQRKTSKKPATCSDSETDVYSLLIKIVEICSETNDCQKAADSSCQPESVVHSGKHDTGPSHTVQAPKAARKPRKYKRSKPIRLPPDIIELPSEAIVVTGSEGFCADTNASESADTQHHSAMKSATEFSEETWREFSETKKFSEFPSQLMSAECGTPDLVDGTVVDNRAVMQNVEETETVIAWTASALKMSDPASELLQPRSLAGSVPADMCENQLTDACDSVVQNIDDIEASSDSLVTCPVDAIETESRETCLEGEQKLASDAVQRNEIGIKPANITGCLTADVFTVISHDTDSLETDETTTFSSQSTDDGIVKLLEDKQKVREAGNDAGSLDQNSNQRWFEGGGLLQAPMPCCETSSVDSEVERILSGHVAAAESSSSEGDVCDETIKDVEDDELAFEGDLVVTEYVDVEIIEERETVSVLDNGDELSPSPAYDRRCRDTGDTPHGSEHITSNVYVSTAAAPNSVKETTKDVQFPPYFFGPYDNAGECQLTASPSECYPGWFGTISAAGGGPDFPWPPISAEPPGSANSTEIPELARLSRKRQHPSDEMSDSDDKHGCDDGSQFVIAQHQPTSSGETVATLPVWPWPFLPVDDPPWSTSDEVIDASLSDRQNVFSDEREPATEQQHAAKPLSRPSQNVATAMPTDFDLALRPSLVHGELFPQDEEELSGDSLNGNCSSAVGGVFRQPAVPFGPVPAETWESCSTDSLDCHQAKTGPVSKPARHRTSSTDYISEDSLAEVGSVTRMDSGHSAVNKDVIAAQAPENAAATFTETTREQGQSTSRARVSVRPKRFRNVRAKFKCPKSGVGVKTNRKRKLGNTAKDSSDEAETDSDSTELE